MEVETDFLASKNHFLCIFWETPVGECFFFLSSWNLFMNESFIPAIGKGFFSVMEKNRYFTWKLFSTSGKRHYYEWKPIFKDRICSCRWKLILWLIETIFFLPFWDARATAIFSFAYSGNVFLNAFRLVERDIFWVVETLFISTFQTFLPVIYSDARDLCQLFPRLMET